jgi:hypothetical protein
MIFTELYKQSDKQSFINKVNEYSELLGINPNWLMAVMKAESGLNPQAVNKQPASVPGYDEDGVLIKPSGQPDAENINIRSLYRATGLIQFMPRTAKGLNTHTDDLVEMSGTEQLYYVYKYYQPYKGKIKSYFDLYLVTFFPVAIGKPDNWTFETSKIKASTIAKQNPGIDLNKDDKITIAEFKGYLLKTIPDNLKPFVFGSGSGNDAGTGEKKNNLIWLYVAAIGIFLYFNRRK